VVTASSIGFAVPFVAGTLLSGSDTQGRAAEEAVESFRDGKSLNIVAGYLLVLAGIAFMPLAWAILERVSGGMTSLGDQVARWTAQLVVAMVLVSGMLFASLAAAVSFGAEEDPPVDLIRYVPQVGLVMLLIAAALCAGLFLVLVSRAGQRAAAVPQWFWILGYVAAVAMVAGVVFVPMVLLPIWAISAGVVLRRPAGSSVAFGAAGGADASGVHPGRPKGLSEVATSGYGTIDKISPPKRTEPTAPAG
jgi:hypothetical protein